MRREVALALVVFFMAAGCIQPVQNLGCCLKVNATNATNPGCILYNTTSLTTTDFFFSNTTSCNATSGCNVTINGRSTNIPICTDDQIVSCISPNCVAMVCGDFAYKPRVAPGYTDLNSTQGNAPPDLNKESATLQFYKARCVLNPLDSTLRQIMMNSKSQIDVFRVGVGGSFDEFDQYRYYFPISDQFCNINPPRLSTDTRVDRFMNYLNGDLTGETRPTDNVTSDCVQDPNVPGFLGFGETSASRTTSGIPSIGSFTYQPVVPDASNYKFSHFGRVDFFDTYQNHNGGFYTYDTPRMNQSDVYKAIDTAYYRKYLSIAHTDTIYGLTADATERAPFECDASQNDCYSGSCDTTIYNRGVMLKQVFDTQQDVITDCNEVQDENGMTKVICAPTTTVTQSGAGAVPDRHYANVDILPMHIETNSGTAIGTLHYPSDFTSIVSDLGPYDAAWNSFNTTYYTVFEVGADRVQNKVMDDIYFYNTKKKYCPVDYGTNNDSNTTVVCSSTTTTPEQGPPAGGAVFFGKIKDDKPIVFRGNTIIGYSLASPSDFANMLLIKNCSANMTPILPSRPNITGTNCWTSCVLACWTSGATNLSNKCTDWCDPTQSSPAPPCTPSTAISTSAITETNDWIRVDLSSISDKDWQDLVTAFQPYFDTRATAIGNKGVSDCGGYIDPSDVALSSMPWVINYEKGINDPAISLWNGGSSLFNSGTNYGLTLQKPIGYHMSATAAQALRTRNIYDENMSTVAGTSACELTNDAYWWFYTWGNNVNYYYNIAFSKYIYLLKYNSTTKSFGQCLIDENTKLPQMKTFGWCQACTTSTLAYQKITAGDRVYMPEATMRIQNSYITDYASICTSQYKTDWAGFFNFRTTDNVTCYNPYITDVNEYALSIGGIGSPRTVPEATIIKERAGNYLKSGIMPVLDISDYSNWNLTNPDSGSSGFCLFYFGNCADAVNYQQYDFERLFGNMGAVVAIVDHVSDANDAQNKLNEIINRTTELHDRCFGCLAAVHVDSPSSLQSFNETISPVITDPVVKGAKLVDLVTFDYAVSDHSSVSAQGAQAVADDITSYGRTSLQQGGVPTLVVGFNVKNSDSAWSESNVSQLFNTIVDSQDELVKAGVIGIVYSPARGAAGNDNTGLVDVSGGVGSKTQKFCAFEGAMHRMSTIPPNAMFTRVQAVNETACVPCDDLDYTQGKCGPPPGGSAPVCDNNQTCTMPPGQSASAFKCPENTVVGTCNLCQDLPGQFHCTKTYANGTSVPVDGNMSELNSDIWLDVIGGIPKPNKCCLLANITNSTPYTYTEQSFATPLNKPLVFPKSGDPNVDCGFGSSIDTLNQLSNFCNVQQVPLKGYSINCTVSG